MPLRVTPSPPAKATSCRLAEASRASDSPLATDHSPLQGTTMALTPNSAALAHLGALAGLPRLRLPDGRTIDAPHPEWLLHQLRWRWLLASWEGGEAYRTAVYGYDIPGVPVRTLIRHKREYPSSFDASYSVQSGRPLGTDQANQATDDDFE